MKPPILEDGSLRRTLGLAQEHLLAYQEHLAERERARGMGMNIVTEMRQSVRGTLHRIERTLEALNTPPQGEKGEG